MAGGKSHCHSQATVATYRIASAKDRLSRCYITTTANVRFSYSLTMAAPPLPPLPPDFKNKDNFISPPAVPPLPPNFRLNNEDYSYESPPHFADPLVAPRPHKLDHSIPANVGSL